MKMYLALVIVIYLMNSIQEIAASLCYETTETIYPPSRYMSPPLRKVKLSSSVTCYNVSSVTDLYFPLNYTHLQVFNGQDLHITESEVDELPNNAFVTFPYLSELHLIGIHLKRIQPGAFNNLTRLQEIYLDNNDLTEVADEFSSLHYFRKLSLSKNKINNIEISAFQNLRFLEELYLGDNNITQFNCHTTNLSILDLSGNRLQELPETMKIPLNNSMTKRIWTIGKLNLSSNHLESFNGSLLLPHVEVMDLANNKIVSVVDLESSRFNTISFRNNNIKTFNGSFGQIENLDISGNQLEELPDSLFNRSIWLTSLYISNNKISKIGINVFSGLYNLRILHLDYNKIQAIPSELFRDLKKLEELDLSSNQLKNFQFGSFDSLVNLQTLNISNNKIIDLNPHVFHAIIDLQNLHIDRNLIFSLDVDYITSTFRSLKSISLDYNPWHCKELVVVYQKFSNTRTKIIQGEVFDKSNVHGIACFIGNSTFNNSSEHPFDDYYGYIREVIDNDVAGLEMGQILAEEIEDMEIMLSSTESTVLEGSEDTVLVAIAAIQVIMVSALLIVVSLVYVFLKRIILRRRAAVASRLELVSAE